MAARTSEGYKTPIPNREIEARATGSGPVTTYKLSAEELAKYGTAVPRQKPVGVVDRPSVSSEEQSRRAKARYQKEESYVKDGQAVKSNAPDKVKVLEGIVAGKSLGKMEREWGMSVNTLSYWMGKWGWKGVKAERAQQLLDEMQIDEGVCGAAAAGGVPAPVKDEQSPAPTVDNGSELAKLRKALEGAAEVAEQSNARIEQLEQDKADSDKLIHGYAAENAELRKQLEALKTAPAVSAEKEIVPAVDASKPREFSVDITAAARAVAFELTSLGGYVDGHSGQYALSVRLVEVGQ